LDYRSFIERVEKSFKSSGFVQAERTPTGIDLAMGKQWMQSLFTFAFLRGDQLTREEINNILDAAFTKMEDEKAPFILFGLWPFVRGAKSTILTFVFEEPSDVGWILSEAKRSKFLGKSYVVSWIVDLKTEALHKNKGIPKIVGIGEEEVKIAFV
jgi:hypothetical protein